jgi:hypothetical protein
LPIIAFEVASFHHAVGLLALLALVNDCTALLM